METKTHFLGRESHTNQCSLNSASYIFFLIFQGTQHCSRQASQDPAQFPLGWWPGAKEDRLGKVGYSLHKIPIYVYMKDNK